RASTLDPRNREPYVPGASETCRSTGGKCRPTIPSRTRNTPEDGSERLHTEPSGPVQGCRYELNGRACGGGGVYGAENTTGVAAPVPAYQLTPFRALSRCRFLRSSWYAPSRASAPMCSICQLSPPAAPLAIACDCRDV